MRVHTARIIFEKEEHKKQLSVTAGEEAVDIDIMAHLTMSQATISSRMENGYFWNFRSLFIKQNDAPC
eukprot:15233249-Ditylum_brightwellii.AAC.1